MMNALDIPFGTKIFIDPGPRSIASRQQSPFGLVGGKYSPKVRFVSTLLSHQLLSLSAVSVSEVLRSVIALSLDGFDILIAVFTVDPANQPEFHAPDSDTYGHHPSCLAA
jgi:hypothetical protein